MNFNKSHPENFVKTYHPIATYNNEDLETAIVDYL